MKMQPSVDDWERAALVCREVAELPDRTSADLTPDEMIVTGDELQPIVAAAIAEARFAAKTIAEDVADEIVEIMRVYDQQQAEHVYGGTPGGLEHMGDGWRLLNKWRDRLVKQTG
jgi:hypothetical protein